MTPAVVAVGKRFARLATRAVVARPSLWRLFRRPLRAQFDALAPDWDGIVGPEALAPLSLALARLDTAPARALDLGTGTGKAARLVAERFAEADVVGVDLAPAMVEQARRLLPAGPRRARSLRGGRRLRAPLRRRRLRSGRPAEHDSLLRRARPCHGTGRNRGRRPCFRPLDADLDAFGDASSSPRSTWLWQLRGARRRRRHRPPSAKDERGVGSCETAFAARSHRPGRRFFGPGPKSAEGRP